jgi:hypothetical protein
MKASARAEGHPAGADAAVSTAPVAVDLDAQS